MPDDGETEPIPISEIERRGVLGQLGHPLGTKLTVEGTVFDGDTSGLKGESGRMWLDIQRVAGDDLPKALRMKFDLEEWTPHGTNLDDDELPPITKEVHGQPFKYLVYEKGGFVGDPEDVIWDRPFRAGAWWRFTTYLVVMRDLNETND